MELQNSQSGATSHELKERSNYSFKDAFNPATEPRFPLFHPATLREADRVPSVRCISILRKPSSLAHPIPSSFVASFFPPLDHQQANKIRSRRPSFDSFEARSFLRSWHGMRCLHASLTHPPMSILSVTNNHRFTPEQAMHACVPKASRIHVASPLGCRVAFFPWQSRVRLFGLRLDNTNDSPIWLFRPMNIERRFWSRKPSLPPIQKGERKTWWKCPTDRQDKSWTFFFP